MLIVWQVEIREKEWKQWSEGETPEEDVMPGGIDKKLNSFQKLLMIRCWCPDRTLAQARHYISEALGPEFLRQTVLCLDSLVEEADSGAPLVCLLTTGSDPCEQVEGLARARGQEYHQLAMGQGQEDTARRLLADSMLHGHWLMLQNCQLCLQFCEELVQTVQDQAADTKDQFRLWLTTEIHNSFPISMLQLSLKEALKYYNEVMIFKYPE